MPIRSLTQVLTWSADTPGAPSQENVLWSILVPRSLTPRLRIGIAIGALAAGVVFRLPIVPWLTTTLPFTTFFPFVVFAALAAGAEIGLFVAVASGLIAIFVFGSAHLRADPVPRYLIWLASCVISIVMASAIRQLIESLRAQNQALEASQARIRAAVREAVRRSKSSLDVVFALVKQTPAPGSGDAGALRQALLTQLDALQEAHDAVLTGRTASTTVAEVLLRSLSPFRPGQFEIPTTDMERVALPVELSITLALSLRELADWSLKRGALADPSGRVALTVVWRQYDIASLVWTEHTPSSSDIRQLDAVEAALGAFGAIAEIAVAPRVAFTLILEGVTKV